MKELIIKLNEAFPRRLPRGHCRRELGSPSAVGRPELGLSRAAAAARSSRTARSGPATASWGSRAGAGAQELAARGREKTVVSRRPRPSCTQSSRSPVWPRGEGAGQRVLRVDPRSCFPCPGTSAALCLDMATLTTPKHSLAHH
ncbi:hypothetical protein SETIT_9G388500v2 [Setaria italica]|uniref:Uncharacterized protein n=1 Tax=Setaria italica TaxID=4555 RepID=A0A368SQA4_SETIT|nr:hypothetical protein SETIT_9G388500v2 [Setaria italica]